MPPGPSPARFAHRHPSAHHHSHPTAVAHVPGLTFIVNVRFGGCKSSNRISAIRSEAAHRHFAVDVHLWSKPDAQKTSPSTRFRPLRRHSRYFQINPCQVRARSASCRLSSPCSTIDKTGYQWLMYPEKPPPKKSVLTLLVMAFAESVGFEPTRRLPEDGLLGRCIQPLCQL